MTRIVLEQLHSQLDAVGAAWAAALPAFGATRGAGALDEHGGPRAHADSELEEMSGPGLVRVLEEVAALRRAVDSMLVRVGDEVAKRSAPQFGADGLAKQHGHASPARLLAAATGTAPGEAARILTVGEATRSRTSFTGEVLPARCEHVRAGLDAGALSVEAAAAITSMLRRVELRAEPALLGPYEEQLVEVATRAPMSLVARAVKVAEARLDTDGVAPTDERLSQERSVTLREDASGMFHLRARLDPVTAAPLKAALDALVGDALRRRGSGADPVVEDRRSIPQIQADALADLARHALGCESGAAVLAKTTIVVRLDLDALVAGTGLAEIDGIDRPIAASTARRLAADAEYIPAVLGGRSVPLDLGRSARLFTRAQRLALAERDGGCASCGQNITYADAHHIDWWTRDSGATDLSNGVMLCTACHRQIHDHGWNVRITDDTVWFIPPPHLDPAQTPRLGGKARYHPDPSPSPSPRRAPARDVGRNSALREDGAAASSPLNAHGSAGAA